MKGTKSRQSRISRRKIKKPQLNLRQEFQNHFDQQSKPRLSLFQNQSDTQFDILRLLQAGSKNKQELQIQLPERKSHRFSQNQQHNHTEKQSHRQNNSPQNTDRKIPLLNKSKIKNNKINQHKANQSNFKNKDYDYLNLTLTFYNNTSVKKLFTILFAISIFVRGWTLCYLSFIFYIGITQHQDRRWEWMVAFFCCRGLFFLMVLKISLSINQGPIESFLKNCWCPYDKNDVFDRLTPRKVLHSLKLAIIPPQLCLAYISKQNKNKRLLIFAVINYIYLSIQVTIFHTFITIYFFRTLRKQRYLDGFELYVYISFLISFSWMLIFWIFSGYLLIQGLAIKYERQQ